MSAPTRPQWIELQQLPSGNTYAVIFDCDGNRIDGLSADQLKDIARECLQAAEDIEYCNAENRASRYE